MKQMTLLFILSAGFINSCDSNKHTIPTSSSLIPKAEIKESNNDTSFICPMVEVSIQLKTKTIKYGQDIPVGISLMNNTDSMQSVWFDKPKISTGGPAYTAVNVTDKKTGRSVLKYGNKALLSSQIHSTEEVNKFSYGLKPGEKISRQFSLYDMVVLLDYEEKLDRGDYEMQIFYCSHASNKITFSVR